MVEILKLLFRILLDFSKIFIDPRRLFDVKSGILRISLKNSWFEKKELNNRNIVTNLVNQKLQQIDHNQSIYA